MGKENKSVVALKRLAVLELVGVSSALEAEVFKHAERSFYRQAVNVHLACFLNYVVRVVLLVNANGDAVGRVCNLGNGVNDKSVVLFAVVRGNNIQTVADVEQSGEVVFCSRCRRSEPYSPCKARRQALQAERCSRR